jgi:hypothetical protein
VRLAIDWRMDQSVLALPPALLEVERVRAALRAVATRYWANTD